MLDSTPGGQRRGSHGNPTLSSVATHPNSSVWRPCSITDCCSPNSILSLLLEELPWIRAEGRGVQFPVSHLCSNQSPLTPWGAGSRKSPAQDTQIHGCSRLSQTALRTHRAPQAQSPRTSSPRSTALVPPRLMTLNALSHLNLISALFLSSPHCTACGIVIPRPGTEPVPHA